MPEANPVKMQMSIRRLAMARQVLANAGKKELNFDMVFR
jgi:hypothetical protein